MQAKRYAYLIHRWTGVLMCILMAIWFASGIVMLFVGYPKLTPWERLGTLPPILEKTCCVAPEVALIRSQSPEEVKEIILTSIRNQPHYLLRQSNGAYMVIDAASGNVQTPVDKELALAGAQAFMPGTAAQHAGIVNEDRWTHSRSLDPHRPLHVVDMHDGASTRLYVSSATGQVMLDAPREQRLWNFAGAWLHWLYMFRNQPVDPVWSWIVIILSAIGVVTAFTGALNGIWRWRFSRIYKNGSRSPYREAYLRWHHILGLIFGTILFIWIFSGLMSMNPLGIFNAKGLRPDMAAFQGGSPASLRLPLNVPEALSLLKEKGFQPSELEWRVMDGKPYILARNSKGDTKLIARSGTGFAVLDQWPDQELLQAARHLLPSPILSYQKLDRYDTYYYKRQVESMYGANERRLSALRIIYNDLENTWVHLDVNTGQVELSMDRSQRLGRWLFNFLHSWDLPAMLHSGWMREAVLILLSIGGLLLSSTAVVIGLRRVRKWLAKAA